MDELDTHKQYQKYKNCVKLWETNFKKKNGRIPSKYDIREADTSIRQAYKMYYRLKSSFLETTLSQLIDDDGFDLPSESDQSWQLDSSISALIDTPSDESSFLANFSNLGEVKTGSVINLRNVDENHVIKEFEAEETDAINANAWNNSLNKKPKKTNANQHQPTTSQDLRQNVTEKLFQMSNFTKRNPRKSLARCNLKLTGSSSSSLSSSLMDTTRETLPDLETILAQKALQETTKELITIPKPCNIRVDKGWLNRCDEGNGISNADDAVVEKQLEQKPFGLSNITNCATYAKCTYDKLDQSDDEVIENSEDESDMKPRNVRHVLKKRKVHDAVQANLQTKMEVDVVNEVKPVQKSFKTFSESEKASLMTEVKAMAKVKPLKQPKELKLKKPLPKPPQPIRRSSRGKSSQLAQYLESKSDEQSETDPFADDSHSDPEFKPAADQTTSTLTSNVNSFVPASTRTMKAKKSIKMAVKNLTKKIAGRSRGKKLIENLIENEQNDDVEDMPENYIPQIEANNIRNIPRIDIEQLKKDTALFQEYVNNMEPVKTLFSNNFSPPTKRDVEREKLEKKIAAGKLNENFVRIDVRKKVFVRGKKTVNFSKYKKSKWKKQKAANALAGPEMDMRGCDGGFMVCFNCGQQGHFAQKCKVQSDRLLPLNVEVEEESPFPTLDEAAKMAMNRAGISHFSRINLPDPSTETNEPTEIHSSHSSVATTSTIIDVEPIKQYIGHSIPTDFLLKSGLLDAATDGNTEVSPMYTLNKDGSTIDTPSEVYDALKLFGHTDFRKGQDKAVMRVLSGRSTLVTLSTGSGKSLCYQLPAYLYKKHRKCITLVISPLVSLMEDQVRDVPHFLTAECLHSNQPKAKHDKIMERIKLGEVDILLISPEAVVAGEKSTGFGSLLRDLPQIAFACIDEAHCMSQWSHNFRPCYLMICRVLREKFKVKTVLGLTATATLKIRESIVRHLQIPDGLDGVISDIPLPNNLLLTVSKDENRDSELLALLRSDEFISHRSIIIYCGRRDECNRVADYIRTCMQDLQKELTSSSKSSSRKRKRPKQIVESYHAGLPASRRRTIQNDFMNGYLKIVVATIAFGMGINKSDIRAVIHYNMPMTYESYVQEVGRAGRDGLPAHCHLFLEPNGKDKVELRRHIYGNSVDRHVIRKLLQKVFQPCACAQNQNQHEFQSEIDAVKSMDWTDDFNDDMVIKTVQEHKCRGHEIGIPIDETIQALDIPEENIETLLNYLELDERNYIQVLSKAYCVCKLISYEGPKRLKLAAQNCAPLAMAIALDLNKGITHNDSSSIEFNVIEIASAIGWDSGVVKFQLKNLEWTTVNGLPKRSSISVQFQDLGFRIRSRGDLSDDELDATLNDLYLRVVSQEQSQLTQLNNVFSGLSSVAYPTFAMASMDDSSNERSDQLKNLIRAYFQSVEPKDPVYIDERIDNDVSDDQLVRDVRSMISLYPENNFTGRNIARIFHGVPSPVYPAEIWSRCKMWRAHVKTDFNRIIKVANTTIVKLRT